MGRACLPAGKRKRAPTFPRGARFRSGAGFGCGFWLAGFVGGYPKSFDFQAFVHVEALFAVETLYEFAGGFSDGAGDAGGVDFDGAALGSYLAVFELQGDIVSIHYLASSFFLISRAMCPVVA